MIDTARQIEAVRRQVGRRVLEAGEARTVVTTQTFDATVDDVWNACTDSERLPLWFLPVSGDLRLGGRYQLEGNAGGTVQRCDPPKGFAATWEYGGNVSWIEVRLSHGPAGGTTLELEHIAHVDEERWAEFGPGEVGVGWDLAFRTLAVHLSPGRPVARQESEAWATSGEGRRFVTLSSRRWCEASVAAGTDEGAALAAAERTTAAYTATEEPDGS